VSESTKDYVSRSNENVEHAQAPREVTDVEVGERIEKFAPACKSGVKGLRHNSRTSMRLHRASNFPCRRAKREFQRDRARIYCFDARAREVMKYKRQDVALIDSIGSQIGLPVSCAEGRLELGHRNLVSLAILVQRVILTTVLAQLCCLIISIRKLQFL
jgi:hypothetical protein